MCAYFTCRVREDSPGHVISSSESDGSSHKLIGGLQFLFCHFSSTRRYVIGTRWHFIPVDPLNNYIGRLTYPCMRL